MLRLDLSRKNLAKALDFNHVERGVEQFTQLGGLQHLPRTSISNDASLRQKQHPFYLRHDRVDPMGDLHDSDPPWIKRRRIACN